MKRWSATVAKDLAEIFEHLDRPLVRGHKRLDTWREYLRERVWRQQSLVARTGSVGVDFEALLDECEEFYYVEQSMHDEIERRTSKEEAA